jgi:UDP-N-acetylmuramate--alanine ligase
MEAQNIKSVFFVGIGGIGMSALARFFNMRGVKVVGYDKIETILTKKLVEEGIQVHYEDDVAHIGEGIELVVYTPAIPADHKQMKYFKDHGYKIMKRAELLGLISKTHQTLAIAGTHGKTTTSALVAHTLLACNEKISAFLGGILNGYNTNYFLGDSPYVVVEADEFDRSFLHLSPFITALNSIDPDHLDIYGNNEAIRESYLEFVNKTSIDGYLMIASNAAQDLGTEEMDKLKSKYKVLIFGFEEGNDVYVNFLEVKNGRVVFDFFSPFGSIEKVQLRMPGIHNISNAAVAITIALILGKNNEDVWKAIDNFEGIKRRFEWIVDSTDKVYIDDYAHHPTELKMSIGAARMIYPGKKVLGIFQPHLFSRTRDFMDGFAQELSKLDEVILMDIYPARELPIEGITSKLLFDKIENENKYLLSPEEILEKVKEKSFDVVMTLGAGNIDLLIPQIKQIVLN